MRTGATGALAQLARTGCTTTMDHHYVFPADGGDLLAAEIEAARTVGLRFLPTRGSMDLGQSQGGLPPDHVVEEIDAILDGDRRGDRPPPRPVAGLDAADRRSPPARRSRSPASCWSRPPKLARDKGVRLHTHLAETVDEETFCRERFGCSPVEYVESLGWLGPDVWLAHGVHLDDGAITALAASQTGVAHCPSSNARLGAGICRTRDLRVAGVPVGLGVDGAASNEAASLVEELRHSVLFARAVGGPQALTVRDGLELATLGGARVLGWDDQIGSLEAGQARRRRAVATRHRRARQHRRPGRRAGAGFASAAGAAAGAGPTGGPTRRDGRRRRGTAGGRPACCFGVVARAGR